MFNCPIKQSFGIPCPGCGLQRSLEELLNGNFVASLKHYPALLTLVILFAYLIFHLIYKFKNGANNLKWLFIANVCIIYLSFILSFFEIWFYKK